MTKRATSYRLVFLAGVACFTLYLAGPGDSQPQQKGLVYLQASSPGTVQAGHSNITGIGVFGGLQTSSFLMPNGAGAGKVLQSDANGFASWQTPAGGGFTLPFIGSADVEGGAALRVTNTNSSSGYGVLGQSSGGIGVFGISGSVGVVGTGTNIGGQFSSIGIGMYANSTSATGQAVYGLTSGQTGTGVFGWANTSSGVNYGGFFKSDSENGRGVFGQATATTGTNYGVFGMTASPAGYGVYGISTSGPNGTAVGGYFQATASADGGRGVVGVGNESGVYGRTDHDSGAGVRGIATASSGEVYGGYFNNQSSPGGAGIFAKGVNMGVDAQSTSSTGIAVEGVSVSQSGLNRGGCFESNSTSGIGVEGFARRNGGANYGGYFSSLSSSGTGVYGLGGTGGRFESNSINGIGVSGQATAALGNGIGGRFESMSPSGVGVMGIATAGSGFQFSVGGYFQAGTNGVGVRANGYYAVQGAGILYGAEFTADNSVGAGVVGANHSETGPAYGGIFHSLSPEGYGLYGYTSSTTGANYGVYGSTESAAGYGVYSEGNFGASGTKAFRIDHPLDPLNKYLKHYCAEGPEPLLIYSGTIETDAKGEAWVQLPEYFTQINKDIRYQLTVVEDGDTNQFVQAKVSRKVQNNRFKIRTSAPHIEVSWEVKGVRNDLWVQKHGAPVEVEKEGLDIGKYEHPELYGVSREARTSYRPPPGATNDPYRTAPFKDFRR